MTIQGNDSCHTRTAEGLVPSKTDLRVADVERQSQNGMKLTCWIFSLAWQGAFSLLLLCGMCFVSSAADDEPAAEPADLTGEVLDEGGEPVEGAQIFVESARPRKGSGMVCPSCYPDCRKRARTDAKGEFKLPSMDGNLLFRLVFVAKGYEAKAMDKVEPLQSPLSISMWKRAPVAENQRIINARVYDANGKPATGAVLAIQGAETSSMTTWGGHKKYIQEMGVSDENGIVTLVAAAELKAGLGIIEARGFAKQWVKMVPGKDHIFILHEGILLTGQVMKEGKPVPGLLVGFSGTDRNAGEFLPGWEVATDASGRFSFANLTPDKPFTLYSPAKSAAKLGVLPNRLVSAGGDGTTLDLGKIELQTPLHIHGRVIFEDGEAAFPGSKIGLFREQANDYQEVKLGEEGEFEFNGLGPELVDISLRISGYKFSKKNPNRASNRSLTGHLRENLDDFLIRLEPTVGFDDPNSRDEDNWNVRETPLQSAKK